METIKIGIAENQLLFKKGLISLLKEYHYFKVEIDAENGLDLLEQLNHKDIDILLLDLEMPVMNGFETLEVISKNYPKIRVIILSMHFSDQLQQELIQKGASAYLLKDQDIEIVAAAIVAVKSEGHYENPVFLSEINNESSSINQAIGLNHDLLSKREIEVISWICTQYSNKEIAQKMNLSKRTIDGHLSRIFEKLNINSRSALIVYALKHKLIPESFKYI